ncbi:RuvC [Desulforapulum autotrophicum HRM2]|uniref:Crossover junction endodeoxyribonuclease RuvC n=1 Tax=Desulforapulum autotrophicum (strain ATCC 43914 / DSM 3382 / VKM B-1955 / HRM2) TaxID=177437 RepID=C0QKP6_DESAH|nr:RuvC [Desulforapulum autotrophicum HRM2]
MSLMVKVIGLDPGLAGTGIGVIEGRGTDIADYSFGSISTHKDDPTHSRLNTIFTRVCDFLCQEKPDLVVIEDVFSLEKYPGSGIMLGKVSGVLLVAAFKAGARVEELSVREAKRVVTGSGSADKNQVEKSVRNILNHPHPIRPFHAADALALALAGFYRRQKQL